MLLGLIYFNILLEDQHMTLPTASEKSQKPQGKFQYLSINRSILSVKQQNRLSSS